LRLRLAAVVCGLALLMTSCLGDGAASPPAYAAKADADAAAPPAEAVALDDYYPPDQPGPFAVGVTTVYLTDESRWEPYADMYRSLPLEVWYPAVGETGTVNTVADMVGPVPKWGWPLLESFYGDDLPNLLTITTGASRHAEPLFDEGPFPVLLFSHGLAAIRFQNYTLAEHLASHGFVIVAPDHFGNAVFTNVPGDDIVLYELITTITGVIDRPLDVNFVYESLAESSPVVWPWRLPLDLETFAILGHSYGAVTSMLSGPLFDFIDVIAPYNPAFLPWYPHNFDKPFYMLQSAFDEIVGMFNEEARAAFDQAGSTHKVHVLLKRGSHYSATDACRLLPPSFIYPASGCDNPERIDYHLANEINAAYSTAFLKSMLLGDDRYDEYLLVNHYPDEVELTTLWPGAGR
jgi:dienelactone hydrolase